MMNNSSLSPGYYTGAVTGSTPPAGVTWVSEKSNANVQPAPPAAEVEEAEANPAQVTAETIVTDVRGVPEVDADGNLVDPDQLAPDSSSDGDRSESTSDTSSSSDTSSGDSSSPSSDSGSSGGDSGGGGGDGN